jgi:hypothetical protein
VAVLVRLRELSLCSTHTRILGLDLLSCEVRMSVW